MKTAFRSFAVLALVFGFTFPLVGQARNAHCVFGDHADDLADDPRFEKRILGDTLKTSRIRGESGVPLYVRIIAIKDLKTGQSYQLNLAEAPEWVGDEARGWIESFDGVAENRKGSGSVVAEIHDSFIRCLK